MVSSGFEITAGVLGRKFMTTSCIPSMSVEQMGNTDADIRSRKRAQR